MDGLSHLRIFEAATGIAGPYAGKLFADAGADVVKLEPPGGDPLRAYSASGARKGDEDGGLFRYLAASKRSVGSVRRESGPERTSSSVHAPSRTNSMGRM